MHRGAVLFGLFSLLCFFFFFLMRLMTEKNVQLIPRNITSVTKITVLSTAKVFILYAKCLIVMLCVCFFVGFIFFSQNHLGGSSESATRRSAQYRILLNIIIPGQTFTCLHAFSPKKKEKKRKMAAIGKDDGSEIEENRNCKLI